jgi:hypothetical protein
MREEAVRNGQHLTNTIVKSLPDAKRLTKDWTLLSEYLVARLVQIAGSDGSASVRAIDALLGMRELDDEEDNESEIDDVATDCAIRYLEGQGYLVRPPTKAGADES